MSTFIGNLTPRNTAAESSSTGGFVNPMPNGTFLETFDKDNNQIPLIGYAFESVVVGDIENGNQLLVYAADNFATFQAGITIGAEDLSLDITDLVTGADMSSKIDITVKEQQVKFEAPAADSTGLTHRRIMLAESPATNDVLHTYTEEGANDSLNNTNYAKRIVTALDVTTGEEDGRVDDYVIVAGIETLATSKDLNGITHHLLTRQAAEIVTGGIAYMAFETGYNTNTYGWQFGAGQTVPGAVAGWNGGAIFTDADAVGVNRTWLNIGTSSSAAFRRVAYWDNAASYSITNDVTSRSFDANSVTLPELADVVATLLRDLNIT